VANICDLGENAKKTHLSGYFLPKWLINEQKTPPKTKLSHMRILILTLSFLVLYLIGCQVSPNEKKSETTEIPATENSAANETYTCVHCDGTGKRVNQLTGTYGKCASCDGTGKVNQYKHDHSVKQHEPSANSTQSDNTYNCPRCGGAGLQTNITDSGMEQSNCTLCQGTGKVNQWTYENINN